MANMFINAMTGLWTSAGTTYSAIKMNISDAGSAVGSKLLQLQIGGVDKFSVGKGGDVDAAGTITAAALESIGDLTLGLGTINGTPFATAERRNRIVNPCMQISQENGDTALTVSSIYPADQWLWSHNVNTITVKRAGLLYSPNKSYYGVHHIVTTATPTLAANQLTQLVHRIEGNRITDFVWGTAGARQVILRFCFYSSIAGTFSVALFNSAANRSFVAPFTISAGEIDTWTTHTIVIPGDVTGTWLTDTGIGIGINFIFAAGSNYVGVAGWQAGTKIAVAGQTNGVGAINNVFIVTDVGLYLDPDNTGVAPPWQMPDEADELRACQRYFWRADTPSGGQGHRVDTASHAAMDAMTITFPTTMRIDPANAIITAPTYINCSAAAFSIACNNDASLRVTTTAAGIYRAYGGVYDFNARM